MISVMISVDDEGMFSVGEHSMMEEGSETMPGEMDMMAEGGEVGMQPAKNLDDALMQARKLIMAKMGEGETTMRDEIAAKHWPGQKAKMAPAASSAPAKPMMGY